MDFKKCKKVQKMKLNEGSSDHDIKMCMCPGTLKVPIINGVHGTPFNPYPQHQCGHAPAICNVDLGERDTRSTLVMIYLQTTMLLTS